MGQGEIIFVVQFFYGDLGITENTSEHPAMESVSTTGELTDSNQKIVNDCVSLEAPYYIQNLKC